MSSRRSIHRSSTISLLKQQRRGVNLPRKKSVLEDIHTYYPSSTATTDSSFNSYDTFKRPSWLEKVRRRSVVFGTKGKVIMEATVTPELRGIYSLRFSPGGESFVIAYGAGAIQVTLFEFIKCFPN